jgi:anti-sigma B factor antagonist
VKEEQIGDVLIVELPARLDAIGVSAIEGKLAETINKYQGKILVDMSNVTFVASLALRMLLTSLKTAQSLGGDLRLCALQPQIAEIFRKSRFDTLFTIYADRETALESYAG